MSLGRWLRHLFATDWATRRCFDRGALDEIERAIQEVESKHAGEIRFAVESALDLPELWRGVSPRQRALQIFGHLGVWDTAANNGVLIYLLMADHDVEIVADRGIAARVSAAEWESVCHTMEAAFKRKEFGAGAAAGVRAIGGLLARHFPHDGADRNELPNRPVLL